MLYLTEAPKYDIKWEVSNWGTYLIQTYHQYKLSDPEDQIGVERNNQPIIFRLLAISFGLLSVILSDSTQNGSDNFINLLNIKNSINEWTNFSALLRKQTVVFLFFHLFLYLTIYCQLKSTYCLVISNKLCWI